MLVDLGKIIKHFESRTFFTVEDVYGRNVDVISREDLLNEFMAMAVRDSLTTEHNAPNLTWEDIRKIVKIADDIADFDTYRNRHTGEEEYYSAVLKRFKENN